MKKILMIANHIDWVYSLRRELIESLSRDYKVVLCIPKCKEDFKTEYFQNMNVDFVFINAFEGRGTNPLKDFGLLYQYTKILKSIKPDVIITYTIKPNVYGSLAAKILGQKTIINVTGLGTGFQKKGLMAILLQQLYKLGCRCSFHAFFQNEANMKLFLENAMCSEEKASLLPGSGVNLERFSPMEKENEDGIIRFIFISRIMKEKGIEVYLEAAEEILKIREDAEFLVVGPIAEEIYRERLADNPYLGILYLGKSDDVREQLKVADCLIHPTYHEGMSNVMLEAGAMEKPLIASDIPGCREIIEEGQNGYLFQPQQVPELVEKIEQFLSLTEEERRVMGKYSREKIAREFDRNLVIDQYLKVIRQITKD